jgi:release factor glutamine methyltransferase
MTRGARQVQVHRIPGVYRPSDDTRLLLETLSERARGTCVLELCAGTGLLALAAARTAASVTAVDHCRRAVATIRMNAALNGSPVTVRRGDLFDPVAGATFDLVLANPPYMPVPASGGGPRSLAWDAGWDGRRVLDRIAAEVGDHLRPNGSLLLVQSVFADPERTAAALSAAGLAVRELHRRTAPLGRVSRARFDHLVRLGVLDRAAPVDQLVVLEARNELPVRPGPVG